MGTRWYQLISEGGSGEAYKIRQSLKQTGIVKSDDIVVQAANKTMIRINDKKLTEFNEWVHPIPKKGFLEYIKGQPPTDGNTIWSRCGWRMMLSMQKSHESKCKDCIDIINDRRNGSDSIGITESGDVTVPTVKNLTNINENAFIDSHKTSGKSTSISTKYGGESSGERQMKAQVDLAHLFEMLEQTQVNSTESITIERWEEIRDEALKLHNHAIEEINRIEEEDAERNQMRDEIRAERQALDNKMKQFEEKFG